MVSRQPRHERASQVFIFASFVRGSFLLIYCTFKLAKNLKFNHGANSRFGAMEQLEKV